MPSPGSVADAVKQQADIVRIIGDYVKLKKSGAQNFTGLCPFHREKTPSFSVHATRQFFHCFGCGASGDVFTFVQKIDNVTFPEAVRTVAQKLGIALPRATYSGPGEAQEAKLRGALLEMHQRACEFFAEQLRRPEAAHAREYLASRGLSRETIEQFRIGYAPDSGFLLRDRLQRDYDHEALKASGLFSWKEPEEKAEGGPPQPGGRGIASPAALYSKFRNRIIFPIANEQGRVIAFTGRTLASGDKTGPKYLNSPETAIYSKSRILYNLDLAREAIRKLDYAILVEGQMDCISVFAAGFHNVIASSGTAFSEVQVRLLARYSRNVVVNFDPDAAGAAAVERSLGLLVGEEFQIKVLTLEPGFDPDLYIRRKGKTAYAAALQGSPKYFDYLTGRARAAYPVKTPEGKVKAVNFLLPHLQRVPSRILRDELAADVAQKLALDSAILRQALKHAAATRSATVKMPAAEPQITEAERILIRVLAQSESIPAPGRDDVDLRGQAAFALSQEPLHRGLAAESLMEALLAAGAESCDPMALELSEADRRLLAATLMHPEAEEPTLELVKGALEALHRRQLQRKQDELKARIVEAERQAPDGLAAARLSDDEKFKAERSLELLWPGPRGSGTRD